MDLDTGGSLLEEGINQQTLNELLGLADELDVKDIPYSPTLDIFPSLPEPDPLLSLHGDPPGESLPRNLPGNLPGQAPSTQNLPDLPGDEIVRDLNVANNSAPSQNRQFIPNQNLTQIQNQNVRTARSLPQNVRTSRPQSVAQQIQHFTTNPQQQQFAATSMASLVQQNEGGNGLSNIVQQIGGQGQILSQGQLLGQGHMLQQTILAGNMRQTPSPILLNAPRSTSPLVIRPQQILPKTAQPPHLLQQATILPASSPNLLFNRAPSPQLVTGGPMQGAPLHGAPLHATPIRANTIMQQGGRILLQPGMRLQGQPVFLNASGQRTLNLNQQNVLNTNVLNTLQPTILHGGNVQNAQILQNVQNMQGVQGNSGQLTNQFHTFQQGRTLVQNPNQGMTIQNQAQILQQNPQMSQNSQLLNADNLQQAFPNAVNVNASGNHVNLLNLNAQPGSQIVIHGNPASSQGSIILGAIPSQFLQMNENGQKILVNNPGMPTLQSGQLQSQNLVLNVGAPGLNLQGTSVQQFNSLPPQKPMANVIGQRQVQPSTMTSQTTPMTSQKNDDIMSKAMSMSAIEIDDDDDDDPVIQKKFLTPNRTESFEPMPGPSRPRNQNMTPPTSVTPKTEMPSPGQAGLSVDSKVQSVIPLSPQIQNALQKVHTEVKNLQAIEFLDENQKGRLDTLLQVRSKIIQYAKDQAAKVDVERPKTPNKEQVQQQIQQQQQQQQLQQQQQQQQQQEQQQRQQQQQQLLQQQQQQQQEQQLRQQQQQQLLQQQQQQQQEQQLRQQQQQQLLQQQQQVQQQYRKSPPLKVKPTTTHPPEPDEFQSAFMKHFRDREKGPPPPNVTIGKSEPKIGEIKPIARRPVAAIAPMQPRTVANVLASNRAAQSSQNSGPTLNLTNLLNAPSTTPLRISAIPGAPLSSVSAASGANVGSAVTTVIPARPAITTAAATLVPAVANTSVGLSTSVGGITRIGIVKASDISSPTRLMPEMPQMPPVDTSSTEVSIQTQIKVGTHLLNMALTPSQKSRIECHLAKLTPQQQEMVFTQQQAFLAKSQKIQLKATAVGPNAKPLILPTSGDGSVQAQVVSNNPLTLKLLSQPSPQLPAQIGQPAVALPPRGVRAALKRPATPVQLPTLPSKIAMVKQELENNRRDVIQCADKYYPFRSWLDICRRLTRYHVYTEMEIPEPILHNDDVKFEEQAISLMNKSEMLFKRFRQSLLVKSTREPMCAERVMMEKIFIEDEKEQLRKDRELAYKHPELFNPRPKLDPPLIKVENIKSESFIKTEPSEPEVIDLDSDSGSNVAMETDDRDVSDDATEDNEEESQDEEEEELKLKVRTRKELRITLTPIDDLSKNLQLSPASPRNNTPRNFDVPSFEWVASPSEAPKAPLKLILRKSGSGFQNLSSPAPQPESDDEMNESNSFESEESVTNESPTTEIENRSEAVDDDESETIENESETVEDQNVSESETEIEERGSVSTEVDVEVDVEASPVASVPRFTSEFGRQISQGFEEISDDDEPMDSEERSLPGPSGYQNFPRSGPYYDFQRQDSVFLSSMELNDESEIGLVEPVIDLGDQMQNAIDSILSLQSTDIFGNPLPKKENSQDVEAAVNSILF